MAIPAKKKGVCPMPQNFHAAAMIEQVQALNGLFLTHLHESLRSGGPVYGLSAPNARSLAELESLELESLAVLPRALFRIDLTAVGLPQSPTPLGEVRRALHLTLLLTAAQASRQHPVLARFLFGLDATTQTRLTALPLTDYLQMVGLPGLVTCAFARRPSLWHAWLRARKGRLPTDLMLLALQPDAPIHRARAPAARSLA
jgi:hypothetical protein